MTFTVMHVHTHARARAGMMPDWKMRDKVGLRWKMQDCSVSEKSRMHALN